MTATTETGIEISIDTDLKARIAAAAAEAGISLDRFIRDAIIEMVERAEEDAAFHKLGNERWAEFERTGMAVPWDAVKAWLEAKARGENPSWPDARKIEP